MSWTDQEYAIITLYGEHQYSADPKPGTEPQVGLGHCQCGEQMYWCDHAVHFARAFIAAGVAAEPSVARMSDDEESADDVVAQRITELQRGAQLLRDNPGSISHVDLVALVAEWIDAEALMWKTSQRLVALMNAITAEVSGGRAGKVHFGVIDGHPQVVIDTSTHADRIIAAAASDG